MIFGGGFSNASKEMHKKRAFLLLDCDHGEGLKWQMKNWEPNPATGQMP